MTGAWLAWLLLGCGGPDPDLVAQRDAIAAWRAGTEALDAGRADDARQRFAEARVLRPRDGLLHAWEARAALAQGRSDEAEALLREGLELAPELHEARYDLAALLARAGRHAEAAPELQRALAGGVSTPREARADPAFAGSLGDPAFAFLPAASVEAALKLPDGPVFWGSQATVGLVVDGVERVDLALAAHGPVEVVSVVADGGGAHHELAWTLLALAAGPVTVGPGEVAGAPVAAPVAAGSFEVVAPPDKPAVPARAVPLLTPEGVAAGLDTPGARAGEGEVVVRYDPAQRVTLSPDGARPERYDKRRDGRTEWSALRWRGLAPGDYEVVVRSPAGEVLRQVVRVAATPPG